MSQVVPNRSTLETDEARRVADRFAGCIPGLACGDALGPAASTSPTSAAMLTPTRPSPVPFWMPGMAPPPSPSAGWRGCNAAPSWRRWRRGCTSWHRRRGAHESGNATGQSLPQEKGSEHAEAININMPRGSIAPCGQSIGSAVRKSMR